MSDFAMVSGAKGGKAGGGGRAPKEDPDNLLTDSTAYVIDVVSEGEIEGWADPENPGKCIFFDDTPLQNPDGTFNFEGVEYWLRTGTPDQPHVPGFGAVEAETAVGVEVKDSQPVARSVSSVDVDAVRIKIGLGQLSKLDTKTGDLKGSSVTFAIDMQVGVAEWFEVGEYTITGKTTSGYQKGYRIELPAVRPVSLRVRRVTPEPEKSNIQNAVYFVSMTEIIDAKLSYPNTAYVALAVPAQAFGGQIPRRSYLLKGMRCFVPSNYDPETRQYDESVIWDGSFKLAYTDNPAFFTYTVYVQDRWGLGERIAPALVDKWRIYQIGKYCDGLVPDGLGGYEPRFTINGVINTREAAYDVITKLSGTFRGVTYWGAGAVVPVQDAPSDPVKLVTNANVIDGEFSYSGTALAARKTAAIGSFRNPDNHYKIAAGVVYDDVAGVQRYGRRQADLTNPFQTSRGGALRDCRWLVDTNLTQTETVSYQAGLDHAAIRPGDRILIADKARTAFRAGGRILGISDDRMSVELDGPVVLGDGEAHSVMLADEMGGFLSVAVAGGDAGGAGSVIDGGAPSDPVDAVFDGGAPSDPVDAVFDGGGPDGPDLSLPSITVLHLADPVPANVRAGAVFALTASNLQPRLFRVLANKPQKHLFSVLGVLDDPEKYDRVELGIRVDDDAPHILPNIGQPPAPADLDVSLWIRDNPRGLVATVSWQPPAGAVVSSYVVEFTDANGRRSIGETKLQTLDIPLDGMSREVHRVHVAARNVLQVASAFTTLEFQVPTDLSVPADVADLRIKVVGEYAHLTWADGGAAVSHYHVKHLADGAAGGWNQAVDVDIDVPARSLQVPAMAGQFLVKAVSVFGKSSAHAVAVTCSSQSLRFFNVVKDLQDAPNWAGSKTAGLSVDAGELVLDGSVASSGQYDLSEIVDLGAVYSSRVSARVEGAGVSASNVLASWVSLSSVDSLSGATPSSWSSRVQISVTPDDPADPAAVWSEWADLLLGDYLARGLRFRVFVEALLPSINVRVSGFAVQVDMPDRTESGDDVVCPSAGVYVAFDPPFAERPAIAVDGQGLPSGARSVRSQVTSAGFFQQFLDAAGAGVACTFDFVAKGYGRSEGGA